MALLERLGPRLAFACWGNHDLQREEDFLGWSPLAEKLQSLCRTFLGKASVDWRVGKQSYRLAFTHQARGHSMYHHFHDLLRMYREDNYYDIGISGHLHSPAILQDTPRVSVDGKPIRRIAIKVGTYKGADGYCVRFFKPGVVGVPAVVLYPEAHEMVPFRNVRQAMAYAQAQKEALCPDV